jgi:hypothetical protein
MKIGGHGEFWMVVGPVFAIMLVATFAAGGPADVVVMVERFANDAWDAAVTALRR